MTPPASPDIHALVSKLRTQFSMAELRNLAFDINVDHENLPGNTKSELARELALYCQRHGKLPELEAAIRKARPSPPVPAECTAQKGDGFSGPGTAGLPKGTGKRWAVLVGVNRYDDAQNYGPLTVCVQDAEALRNALIAGGWEAERIQVVSEAAGSPPTRAAILATLQAVADATEPDDTLLFYYSGHGSAAGGNSYLVAQDSYWNVLTDTAVPVPRVREILQGAKARAMVIVLDACHSGAQIGKGAEPMSAEFIRHVFEQAEGMAILASCKQGEKSWEWTNKGSSVFTHYLLAGLDGTADRDGKEFVTVQDIGRYVLDRVKVWAAGQRVSQTPTLQAETVGDIILAHHTRTPP